MSQIKMLQIVNWFKNYFFRPHSVVEILQVPVRIVSPAQNRITNMYILGFVCFGIFLRFYSRKNMTISWRSHELPTTISHLFGGLISPSYVASRSWVFVSVIKQGRTPREEQALRFCSCAQLNDNNPYTF